MFTAYLLGYMGWQLLLHYGGWVAVIIGLFLGGVGVVPIGMLAAIFNGHWDIFLTLLLTIVLTYGARIIGYALANSADSRSEEIKDDVIDIEPEKNAKRTWGDLE